MLVLDKRLYQGDDCLQVLYLALIQKTLSFFRLAALHEDTVDLSIYCLHKFLNRVGVINLPKVLPEVFSLITHAYIAFFDSVNLKRFCQKIFEFYIVSNK